ncbi:hypothetical protein HU200_003728 [Digitaria exilis]|uniref:Uncharacterized protein n=1 Tax=Digitaria exilis TaxID=1010633 RepID=A0A835FWA8_9POAL|nr:hypothetical protein HU200_003728 [Digitaria exilis]
MPTAVKFQRPCPSPHQDPDSARAKILRLLSSDPASGSFRAGAADDYEAPSRGEWRRGRRRWGQSPAGRAVVVVCRRGCLPRGAPRRGRELPELPGIPSFPSSSRGGCGCPPARKYTGMVEDCCCEYETVDSINEEVLHPILQELVKLPFFRYFKVKLWCDCPFWPDDGMCQLRDCSVCECPENEFPEPFKKPYSGLSPDSMICQEGKPQAAVDKTLDSKAFKGWVETDNPWTADDETDNNEMTYVNLQLNPERYTGYTGDSARRIWDSIYKENCPKCMHLCS